MLVELRSANHWLNVMLNKGPVNSLMFVDGRETTQYSTMVTNSIIEAKVKSNNVKSYNNYSYLQDLGSVTPMSVSINCSSVNDKVQDSNSG